MKSSKTAVSFVKMALALVVATACSPVGAQSTTARTQSATVDAQSVPSGTKPTLQPLPGVYRFDVGDLRMTVLSDGTVAQDLYTVMPQVPRAEIERSLYRGYVSNPLEASINVVLIEMGERRVLVDTGSGELFGPGNGGKLVSALQAVGLRPDRITDILLTHIHGDHSGGLVVNGKMLFPNAIVHVGKPDVDFFLDRSNSAKTGYAMHYFDEAIKCVKPYVDAGKVRTFSRTAEVLPGITATLHPGHTPGTAFYVAESRGEKITFIGDTIHFGAIQFPNPSLTVAYDVDSKEAARVRTQQFSTLAQQRMLVAAPHLPFPGVGHMRPEPGGSFSWVPVDYTNRQP